MKQACCCDNSGGGVEDVSKRNKICMYEVIHVDLAVEDVMSSFFFESACIKFMNI